MPRTHKKNDQLHNTSQVDELNRRLVGLRAETADLGRTIRSAANENTRLDENRITSRTRAGRSRNTPDEPPRARPSRAPDNRSDASTKRKRDAADERHDSARRGEHRYPDAGLRPADVRARQKRDDLKERLGAAKGRRS